MIGKKKANNKKPDYSTKSVNSEVHDVNGDLQTPNGFIETPEKTTENGKTPHEDNMTEPQVIRVVETNLVKRDKWRNNIDFLFACVGFSVGLGNVWRFPFLCYKNGGGAFLLPYFISVFCGGIPIFILEVALGQFMSQGGITAWNICPIFKGIGFAGSVIVFCLNCYYNVILAWALHYLFCSFTTTLPWTRCDGWWNTPRCKMPDLNGTKFNGTVESLKNGSLKAVDPVTEYWENRILGISEGITNMGNIRWDLALCLLLAWLIVFLCICKGIKTSGKVMYITATSPYVLMGILLIRSLTLEGATNGLIYYLKPNWTKIAEPEVWSDAGTQIFFSYSVSLGTLTALGSFNSFHHNSFRDCCAYAAINSLTSLMAGCVIFATIGYMSATNGVPISEVAESGPGLAFLVYPKALSTMPISPLWSCLFFFMILLLGLDSQFVGVEGLVTAISDIFPRYFSHSYRKMGLVGVVCILCFFVGLTMVTQGGMYVFQLFDYYTGSRIILVVAFFEAIVIGYIYGAKRFSRDMAFMFGYEIKYAPQIFLMFIAPSFSAILFGFSVYAYTSLTYERASQDKPYEFPNWSVVLGWGMACSSVIFIPIVAAYEIFKAKGSPWERIKAASKPRFPDELLRRLEMRNDPSAKMYKDEFKETGDPNELELMMNFEDQKPIQMTQLKSNETKF